MTDYVGAVALHTVHFKNEDGNQDTRSKGSGPFRLSIAQFDELEALGGVRRATKEDRTSALDHDFDGDPGGFAPTVVPLTAKHKGGGKYVVVDAAGEIVSGEDLLDDKDAAQAWIDEHSRELSDEEKKIRDEVVNPDPDAPADQLLG